MTSVMATSLAPSTIPSEGPPSLGGVGGILSSSDSESKRGGFSLCTSIGWVWCAEGGVTLDVMLPAAVTGRGEAASRGSNWRSPWRAASVLFRRHFATRSAFFDRGFDSVWRFAHLTILLPTIMPRSRKACRIRLASSTAMRQNEAIT
jgi:hypothetical protein